MEKDIGLDVHAASCTVAVMDSRGKRLGSHVIETNGHALVEFFKMQTGTLHVCLEEGTQAGWLVEILSPHVKQIVVVHVSQSNGQKNVSLVPPPDAASSNTRSLRPGAHDRSCVTLPRPATS